MVQQTCKCYLLTRSKRIFYVKARGDLHLENLILLNGRAIGADGPHRDYPYCDGAEGGWGLGGAIYNEGDLTATRCTLYSNSAIGGNGATGVGCGGDGRRR